MRKYITLPISVLVDLFNSTRKESSVRKELLEIIRNYKDNDKKAHVCEGFIISDEGNLEFNDTLYSEAVHRGKIETYSRSATESMKKLKSSLEMLQGVGEDHLSIVSKLPGSLIDSRISIGEPINQEQQTLLEKISPLLLDKNQ
jgi:hypothetical protein